MVSPIRKRCPKCKTTGIYKRVTLKDMIARSRRIHVIMHNLPSNIYRCRLCGNEFDIPFVGPQK